MTGTQVITTVKRDDIPEYFTNISQYLFSVYDPDVRIKMLKYNIINDNLVSAATYYLKLSDDLNSIIVSAKAPNTEENNAGYRHKDLDVTYNSKIVAIDATDANNNMIVPPTYYTCNHKLSMKIFIPITFGKSSGAQNLKLSLNSVFSTSVSDTIERVKSEFSGNIKYGQWDLHPDKTYSLYVLLPNSKTVPVVRLTDDEVRLEDLINPEYDGDHVLYSNYLEEYEVSQERTRIVPARAVTNMTFDAKNRMQNELNAKYDNMLKMLEKQQKQMVTADKESIDVKVDLSKKTGNGQNVVLTPGAVIMPGDKFC